MYFSGLNIHLDRPFQESSVIVTPHLEKAFQLKKLQTTDTKFFNKFPTNLVLSN